MNDIGGVPTVHYGPGDVRPKLVPAVLAAIRSGQPLAMSDGGQLIDLTYVSDAPSQGTYNHTNGLWSVGSTILC